MRSLLSRDHYCLPRIFDEECLRIFRRLWIFAALRSMVARPNDFRTIEIVGIPVIVQNLGGRIRAFANICRHRQSRIHLAEFGNRPLQCPYHNWAYGDDGTLSSVPRNAQMFKLDPSMMRGIKLQEFAVEVVGGLVFVNLDDTPLPITEQFEASTLSILTSTTDRMDDEFIYTRYAVEFNWKVGIENIKDPLHVACLHRDTFPEHIKPPELRATTGADHERPAAVTGIGLAESTAIYKQQIESGFSHPWQALVERLDSKGYYQGIQLFPNVNLLIVDGSSFSVQVYNPKSSTLSEMQMMVALTRPTGPFDYKPVVLWEHLKSDMTVLRQDIECLEALQRGLPAAREEVIHGTYETGIADFHSAYMGLMEQNR